MSETVTLKTAKLDKLIAAFKGQMPQARVGILGDSAKPGKRANSENATIGAKHEYGQDGLPVRSFLRMPLQTQLQAELERSGAFKKDALKRVVKDGSILQWMRNIAFTAEAVVLKAFDTGGFGNWKPSNMARKKTKQTLVETQQLRNSITSEVTEK